MELVNVVLDMKGLSCPKPLIGAKRMVDELAAGQVLLLISDCPGTQDDLRRTFDPLPFDPERAKALLREAGYGPGQFSLTIT
mgnify:CR=1 FL=1